MKQALSVAGWWWLGWLLLVGVWPPTLNAQNTDESRIFSFQDVLLEVSAEEEDQLYRLSRKSRDERGILRDRQQRLLEQAEAIRKEIDGLNAAVERGVVEAMKPELRRRFQEGQLVRLRENVDRDAEYLRDFASIAGAVVRAEKLVIYEGLPRADEEVLARERREKKTVRREKFDFYAEPMSATPDDEPWLRRLCSDFRSFEPYGGPKFCGGYHPDICLEWQVKQEAYCIYICFGCHEGHFVGPRENFMVDLHSETYEALLERVPAYFRQRPQNRVPSQPHVRD